MWKQYKHKTVRDLAWCLYSERIVDNALAIDDSMLEQDYISFEKHLIELDKNPKPLIDFLANKNTHRLGYYFEQLVFYWLEVSSRYDLVENNIPVRTEKGISKGEVDLIVLDKTQGLHQHWELAVKFFLAYQNTNQDSIYIGPNANDFLHLKLQKLQNHQCKILESTEGKRILKRLNIPAIHTKLFIKGMLFYHPKQAFIIPKNIHNQHQQSWWIYLREADGFFEEVHQFRLLHKKQWLSTPDIALGTMSKKECCKRIQEELKSSPRSLYIAIYKNETLISMGFVVHDAWPNLKQKKPLTFLREALDINKLMLTIRT